MAKNHLPVDDYYFKTLPPEAIAELRRIRLKHRAQTLAAEALLAALIHQQLYPPPEPPEEVDLDRYLAGR